MRVLQHERWGMGLGGTAKKIQKVADRAEQLYSKLNDVYDQVQELRENLEETSERVEQLEVENAKQQALVEALAREQGVDVDEVLADVDAGTADGDGTTDGDGATDAGATTADASSE